jgi:hypothetical protein
MSRGSMSGNVSGLPLQSTQEQVTEISNKLLTSPNWLAKLITGYKKELTTNV